MPWTQHTLKHFSTQKLPAGSILVPACGPGKSSVPNGCMHARSNLPGMHIFAGHELLMLAKSFPDDRQIIGVDLAEGMVDLANARCAEAGVRSVCLYWS